jgi:RNA polymerase sigma-70 factor (ECF subfamily)
VELPDLVQLAVAGDRDAFGELVRRYERLVLGIAWNILRDYHAAQDVAQEAFVTAYRRLADLKNRGAFGPWVAQIAVRCCHQSRDRRPMLQLSADHDPMQLPPEPLLLNEETDRILTAIRELPEHEQTIVFLRYMEGHAVTTIAKLTDRPLGTVTKQLSRAVRRLQNLLIEVES